MGNTSQVIERVMFLCTVQIILKHSSNCSDELVGNTGRNSLKYKHPSNRDHAIKTTSTTVHKSCKYMNKRRLERASVCVGLAHEYKSSTYECNHPLKPCLEKCVALRHALSSTATLWLGDMEG